MTRIYMVGVAPTSWRVGATCRKPGKTVLAFGPLRLSVHNTAASTPYQIRAGEAVLQCFGAYYSTDPLERVHRFIEEAIELGQATGVNKSDTALLVEYVYARPVGDVHQEIGGVMLTLAALCQSRLVDMAYAGEVELDRLKANMPALRRKQESKVKGSPLPGRG